MLDRFELYELCVQSPADLVRVLRAVHGNAPLVLGEDFSGTAAVSRAWVRDVRGGRAIAVDHDESALARADGIEGIETIHGDVLTDTGAEPHAVDVLYAGNFSIGEWHGREQLLSYLRHARDRLRPGGVFVCDTYGGETAFLTGSLDREHRGPDESTVHYTWEQREADPLTGRVVNAIHFRVAAADGTLGQEMEDAFVYRWRLWSIPELRDALRDTGFTASSVYAKIPDAVDDEGTAFIEPLVDPVGLDDSLDLLVVGRK